MKLTKFTSSKNLNKTKNVKNFGLLTRRPMTNKVQFFSKLNSGTLSQRSISVNSMKTNTPFKHTNLNVLKTPKVQNKFFGSQNQIKQSSSLNLFSNSFKHELTSLFKYSTTNNLARTPSFIKFNESKKIRTIQTPKIQKSTLLNNNSYLRKQNFFFPLREIKTVNVPTMGDSIPDGVIQEFTKKPGDWVESDEIVCTIETDKVSIEVPSPESGLLKKFLVAEGDTVKVDQPLFEIDLEAKRPASSSPKKEEPKATPTSETPKKKEESKSSPPPSQKTTPTSSTPQKTKTSTSSFISTSEREHRVPMSRQRLRTAERLKESQNTYALLTTFNEVDMSKLTEMKNTFKDEFLEKHGVKLGFMSTFLKASSVALQENPVMNAVIDGTDILYRDYVDISVAVATPTGLAVPVIRDVQNHSLSSLEKELSFLGQKARNKKLELSDMTGGTFTISNGGVYGSLMGTPIVNPPQSCILGMHGIFKRPVALGNNEVDVRPMMYLALTYDHRLIDGRDAVLFLRRIKDIVEDPRRLLVA